MQNTYRALLIKNTNSFNGGNIQPPMRVVRLHSRGKQTSEDIVCAVNNYNTLNTVLEVVKKYLAEFDTSLSDHAIKGLNEQLCHAVQKAVSEDNIDNVSVIVHLTATNSQDYEIHLDLIPTTVNC